MKKVQAEDMRKLLSDCPPEKCFWINNGPVLKNLEELADVMRTLSDSQFTHHLSAGKNDFAKWVDDVIGDHKLAGDLRKAKSKTAAIKKLNERLDFLRKLAS